MSVRFDAAADRLLRTTDLLDYNAPYTWMAWIYIVVDLDAVSIFWALNDNANLNFDNVVTAADGTTLTTQVRVAGAGTTASGSALTATTWYHVAVVRESVTALKLYLNGTLDSTNTRDVTGRTAQTRTEHGGFRSINASPSNSRVDRIKAWSAALTIDEVNAERWSIRPQRTANLYGFWPTWAGTDRLTDYSGNGRDWTASGTLTDEDPAPVGWVAQNTRLILPVAASVTYTDTGSAASVFTGSGADAAELSDAATATSVFTGSGVDAPVYDDTGTAASAATGSGAEVAELSDTATAVAALFGSGPDVAVLVDAGGGVLIAIGSGVDNGPLPPAELPYQGDAYYYDSGSPTGSITGGTVLPAETIYD